MKLEIATLEAIDAWSVIDCLDHHVIASTWAFKCKRYSDGLIIIKKFKARFCARGDQQIEGIDFFEQCTSRPMDNNKTDVHPGDSVGIEVKAR